MVDAVRFMSILAPLTALTPLAPTTVGGAGSGRLLQQVAAYNQNRFGREAQSITASYQQKINSAGRQGDAWREAEADLEDAVLFLGDVVGRVQRIQGLANDMLTTSVKAEFGDSISALGYQATFNSLLRQWIAEAEDRGGNPNLLGSTSQRSYSYFTDTADTPETVARKALHSDYYIIDSGGYRWERDPDYRTLFKQYDTATGAETGKYASITGGLRLDNLSGDSVTFSILPDTAGEESFTGTLYREGLEVLDAWLYDGLTTAAGRLRAQDDLHEARATIDAELARFKAARATARYYEAAAETNRQAWRSKVDGLTAAMTLALQESKNDTDQQSAANVLIVSQTQAVRSEYLSAFSKALSLNASGLSKALIDVLA